MNIYQEEVMDHYEHPRNQGELEEADVKVRESNASCGDMVEIMVKWDERGRVKEVRWRGLGCAVSMAAMSKMSEWVKGRNKEEIREVVNKGVEALIKEAIGWQVNPGRKKCVQLAGKAVEKLVA